MAVIKNKRILKCLLMMVISLFLILNFSIGVSASNNYDRQEADTCITISQRLSVKGGSGADIVYRAVTPEQAASIRAGKGIVKEKPYAKTNPTQHVGGVLHRKNPWISTTRRLESAKFFATHGGNNLDNPNPIVRIDISKINSNNILDISNKEKAARYLTRPFTVEVAAYHQEVLIYGDVPQEAIIDFLGD